MSKPLHAVTDEEAGVIAERLGISIKQLKRLLADSDRDRSPAASLRDAFHIVLSVHPARENLAAVLSATMQLALNVWTTVYGNDARKCFMDAFDAACAVEPKRTPH
jgi:hypothetical protein